MSATNASTVRHDVADLLGVDPDTLDPQADLIAAGLDSIRMMSLAGRWRRRGVDVTFAALAAAPTVDAWMRLIGGEPAAAPVPDETEPLADDDGTPFPLAPIGHAMWVGRHGDQELGGVAAHLYVEFDGTAVDPERLRTAAARLAARHPMLRQEILPDGRQRIGDRTLDVTVFDLRDLGPAAAAERLADIRQAKSHQQLDGEVFELSLSRLPEGRTRLHVDLDMQAADAVSYRTLMADLAALYRGAELPPLRYTYRQYRAALAASTPPPTEADLRWWAERIPELPEPPTLPLLPRDAQTDPLRSIRLWHTFDVATRDALFTAAHRRGVTPAMAVAATYAHALARWSTNKRFLLNLPMFGREPFHPDVDRLVGDFTSSLLLDVDLTGLHTPAARARAVQEELHRTAAHASVPGLDVLRELRRHRGTQVLATIVYTSALGLGDLFAGDVTDQFGEPVWTISQGPQVLIDAQATPVADELMINWDVRVEHFPPGVAQAMFDHQIAELQRLAADDAAWEAADPPALSAPSRGVRALDNARIVTPSGDTLLDGFVRSAAARPAATAVITGSESVSYGALQQRVRRIAATLQDRGVGRGDVVAVLGPKCADQVPAVLAILTVGAAYLPIGADQPAPRAARILAAADVRFALATGDLRPDVLAGIPAVTVTEAAAAGDGSRLRPVDVDPQDLAYVLFTSGSTGEPKGVELTHDAVMNTHEFVNRHFAIGRDDRALALSTLEGDLSTLDIFGMLAAGGSMVVVDEAHRRDPDHWAALVERHRVTVLHWMPGWLQMLLDVGGDRLSSLRVVPTGGDWVRPDLVRRLRAAAPGVRFAGLGGATETAIHHTCCEVEELPADWAAVPFGRPLPGNACRIVDAAGDDCPDWVPGELWVGGRGIARGYRGRPDLTAERFVQYAGRTWYRTGDLARYRPDGTIEFVGRADHRVKISGYRIELGEVEAALQRVPGVTGAVAAVLPAAADRPGDVLVALVAADAVTAATVRSALADMVPPHMVPQRIVAADRIPFTVGGKIDRPAAVALLQADAGEQPVHRAPATALQAALSAIFAELLLRNDIGIDDDFFALGGDSVLATTAVARIRDWLDTPTAGVPDVFAARTVAGLADRLTAREPASARLEQVAELYLEVTAMPGADVAAELERATS
ncbi:non-ribosomal peptide synthetase [Mycobacterium sp. MYCO198283]|uniref:non-ribosomal peptide synthetase n=1 Tax=Mycobacterium sp. MYCO198283 TaxID=2883505 RepID=UPI001E31212A|nr:non-ribosomal peptide synthetase [Mycobacterium sp. MYCO198283]MCG5432537.1 non-ribosomal peptide synthetase [Mycobacterium sp. MYCO198283]